MAIAWESPAANIERVWRFLEQAPSEVDVWVLPEMWSTGFSMRTQVAEVEPGPALRAMQDWARAKQALLIGSVLVVQAGRYYNRAYVVWPDGSWQTYDKRHLFRMAGEDKVFVAGTDRLVVTHCGWHLALQVCYDLRFPVWSRRTPDYDYDVLIYVANWPVPRTAQWTRLLPARAIENQAYVLGVNRIGQDGEGRQYEGASALYDFLGEKLLGSGEAEGLMSASLSKAALEAWRARFPAWQDADKFRFV